VGVVQQMVIFMHQKLLNSEDELDRIDGEILKNETENTKEMEDRCATHCGVEID